MEYQWSEFRKWGYWMDSDRTFKIKIRVYPPNTPLTNSQGLRFELQEMNTPACRAACETSVMLSQHTSFHAAALAATKLTPWARMKGRKNMWIKRGTKMQVRCFKLTYKDEAAVDEKGYRWEVAINYIDCGTFKTGNAAQEYAELVYKNDHRYFE